MQRRDFLKHSFQACAAAGAMLSVPTMVRAASPSSSSINWSLGWQSVEVDSFAPLTMKTTGLIPKQLNGALLRNGPAKMKRGEQQYKHWFDGDGMVQQFSFEDGKVSHQGRFVQTQKYQKEQAANKFLYGGAGTVFEDQLPARNNDSVNTANTALLEWDNELLALWEGGSAYAMDAQSLATKGIKTWSKDMQHMPFSAHPLIDPTNGSMWNFGFAPYAGKGMLFIYNIEPKTGIKKVQSINLPMSGYMHDFAQTQQSLIFLIPPYDFTNAGAQTFVDSFKWQPHKGSRLLVVNKNDLSQQQWFELPAGFVFHFGHASEQNNELRVNVSWYENANLMSQGMSELMSTGQVENNEFAVVASIIANTNTKQCRIEKSSVALEFPGFDEQNVKANSTIIGVGRKEQSQLFGGRANSVRRHKDTLVSYRPLSGETKEYVYETGVFAEEPLLIKGEGNDWIVQTFLDLLKKQSGINIFSASHIEAGPVGQAVMDRTIPLGFHGTFLRM
jgi:carotenoid cleavage dioxygenase-like enzyme